MIAIAILFVRVLCDCFKSRRRLEAEILVLRHQLNVLRQRAPRRLNLTWADRALFVWLYRRFPRILDSLTIVRPETVVRWHRKGFSAFWRWKSRSLGGRPWIAKEVRDLIRRMSFENPLWGAPHIHGELLKLGFEVAQSTVSKYMVPRKDRPLQTRKTFLHNHADGLASIDPELSPVHAAAGDRLTHNHDLGRQIDARRRNGKQLFLRCFLRDKPFALLRRGRPNMILFQVILAVGQISPHRLIRLARPGLFRQCRGYRRR
jgi:hypothetical protein